ncbi:MAG: SxtJ family membrane protein [Planctomycetota bacterium]
MAVNWRPGPGDLRKFGAVLLVGFGVLGAAFYFGWPMKGDSDAATGLWIAGATLGGLGLSGTKAALPVYWAWMSLAFVMGNVISRVVMILVYIAVVTPMGLFMRVIGRDRLDLRGPSRDSYWHDLEEEEDLSRYERQF